MFTSSSWLWSHRRHRWTETNCSNQQSGTPNSYFRLHFVLNWSQTGARLVWTYNPGEGAGWFLLGYQLTLVRTKQRPLWEDCIHTANIYLASLSDDLQAWWDRESRPVGRSRGHWRIGDEERRPVGRTLLLEIRPTVLADWRTKTSSEEEPKHWSKEMMKTLTPGVRWLLGHDGTMLVEIQFMVLVLDIWGLLLLLKTDFSSSSQETFSWFPVLKPESAN